MTILSCNGKHQLLSYRAFHALNVQFFFTETPLKIKGGEEGEKLSCLPRISVSWIKYSAADLRAFASGHRLSVKTWMGRRSAEDNGLPLSPFPCRSGAELGGSDKKGWERGRESST